MAVTKKRKAIKFQPQQRPASPEPPGPVDTVLIGAAAAFDKGNKKTHGQFTDAEKSAWGDAIMFFNDYTNAELAVILLGGMLELGHRLSQKGKV